METPTAKQNSCYVHFSYFWLPYTTNKSTTCAAASTGSNVYIRLLIESVLFLFQGQSLYGGSLKHRYRCVLYVVNNIPEQFWQLKRCLWWMKANPWHNEPHITNIIVKPTILFLLRNVDVYGETIGTSELSVIWPLRGVGCTTSAQKNGEPAQNRKLPSRCKRSRIVTLRMWQTWWIRPSRVANFFPPNHDVLR